MQIQENMLDIWSNFFVSFLISNDSSWVLRPVLDTASQEKCGLAEKSLQEANLNAQ